ncbi:MAG TPA: HYR domain-containing protein [Methylomirabilota bacterium]|nr:HYR domain-containing protein [Methylomirabilota bacterium]
MTTTRILLRSLAWLALGIIVAGPSLHAQIIANPNQIRGTVRFSNVNPAILSILGVPGHQGFTQAYVYASAYLGGDALSTYTLVNPTTARTSTDYEITVESSPSGIPYAVSAQVYLDSLNDVYWTLSTTSAPVVFGAPPVTLNFAECAGLIDVQFVDPGGNPATVTGGRITAYPVTTPSSIQAQTTGNRSNYTREYLAVRGGETYRLHIEYQTGTSLLTDRIQYRQVVVTNVPCDQIVVVRCVVPPPANLGRIVGDVDMQGEFELPLTGFASAGYYDKTLVEAWIGPFGNTRLTSLPGSPPTVPSSGAFVLGSLLPSDAETPPVGYSVYAQMAFRTNRQFQYFVTPALGYGANASVIVPPGATVNLSNTFVIRPGYLRGRVVLRGPSELPGQPAALRGLAFSGDADANGDGIPDSAAIYGNFWSVVSARGVDRRAPGATLSAAYGSATVSFDGTYNTANDSFEGAYEMVLGGLRGEPSLWKPEALTLQFRAAASPPEPETYFVNLVSISDHLAPELEVVPGALLTNDLAYCLGEVRLRFRSASGTFFQPRVRFSNGAFTGTDFQGQPADYSVYLDAAFGTPAYDYQATNEGLVVMAVPQGTYRLSPYLNLINPGGGYSETELPAIDLTVGCGQRIALEPCLQVALDAPTCSNSRVVPITGSVRSCSNKVASVTYQLNGGAPQTVCTDCGPDPVFGFAIALEGECADNTLVVTATDIDGGTASVSTVIRFNAQPPRITCPTNLVADCQGTNGAVVNFTVTAESACGGAASVVCDPPAGSLFPAGTTLVTCTATDPCGNQSQCTFKVTVRPGPLTIERAICVRWSCGGTLQSADNVEGPWTDLPGATSPYCVPASEAKRFYRVRD